MRQCPPKAIPPFGGVPPASRLHSDCETWRQMCALDLRRPKAATKRHKLTGPAGWMLGVGINKPARANLHPGYTAVQRLTDHNAALTKKEIVGQKYSYFDMHRAAADHGLTIGKVTLAKMAKGDPSVGLRPGQARLLPPQVLAPHVPS